MSGRVIQGFFVGGDRLAPATPFSGLGTPFAGTPGYAYPLPQAGSGAFRPALAKHTHAPLQRRGAPGRPVPAHSAKPLARPAEPGRSLQRFGGDGSFAVDPIQVGLVRGGGCPLPGALLAKMEAALGADFSSVRVHVGAQASRIGALAFTTGNDLYFATGQYQPDSIKGQQLIGHELAHVIQQRQGRVRAPAAGVAVVQDRALEAEADRLGMKAAAHRTPVQRHAAAGGAPSRPGMRVGMPSRAVQRALGSVVYGYDAFTADETNRISEIFADEYKGPSIPYSGSTVYSVGWSEGMNELWSTLNSATGFVGKAKTSDVVKYWEDDEQSTGHSNTAKYLKQAGLKRPSVMVGNAHAEVNQILRHAVYSILNGKSPHDVGLIIGSDVQHCAECWWAYNAVMRKYKIKTIHNTSGTSRKLFERWREPWDGFYTDYGDNPFRASNGSLAGGLKHGVVYDAYILNAKTSGGVGNIY